LVPIHIFGYREARLFKFHLLIDTDEWVLCCKDNNLLRNGIYSGSRDLFTFWEVSDNISEKVQERDIVAMKD